MPSKRSKRRFDDLAFQRVLGRGAERTTTPHFMPYCPVGSVEAALARARLLGARSILPPTPLSLGGRCAIVREPQGGYLGLREL